MATLGNLFVKIGAETSGLAASLNSAERAFSGFSSNVSGRVKGVYNAFFSLKTLLVGGIGLYAIKNEIESCVKASNKQEKSLAGMRQAMISMGRYTNEFHKELIGLASAYQKTTTSGDETTLEGAKFLLTYKQITDDMMPRTIKAMLDLSAFMGGDTTEAARMLGKASMGMGMALRRVGINIDEVTAKSGNFGKILKLIEIQVGGQAEAMRNTGWGGLVALGNQIDDIKEKIGDIVKNTIHPFVQTMLNGVIDINDELGNFAQGTEFENKIIRMQKAIKDFAIITLNVIRDVKDNMLSLLNWIESNKEIVEYGIIGYFLFGKKGAVVGAILGKLEELRKSEDTFDRIKDKVQDLIDYLKGVPEAMHFPIGDMEGAGGKGGEALGKGFSEKFDSTVAEMIKRLEVMKFGLPAPAAEAGAEAGRNAGKAFASEFPAETQQGIDKAIEKIRQFVEEKQKLEEDIASRIYELSHDETQYKIYQLDKQVDELRAHKIDEAKIQKWYALEIEKINQDMYEEITDNLRDYYKKHGSYLQGMAAGWNDYWDVVLTKGEQGAKMMVEVLDGLKDLMSESLFSAMLEEPIDFKKKLEDFRDRILKVWTDQQADNFMKMLKGFIENSDWLRGLGLGEFLQAVENSKKTPTLLELEKQSALLNDILNAILGTEGNTAVLAEDTTKEKVGGDDYSKYLGWANSIMSAYQGYQSGGISEMVKMMRTQQNQQQGYGGLFGGGGWFGRGMTAAQAQQAGYQGPAMQNGMYSQGGGWGTAAGSMMGAAGSMYTMYQLGSGQNKGGGTMGRVGGAMTGAMAGAQLGSMIMPGIGTAVGAVAGAVLGAIRSGGKSDEERKLQKIEDYKTYMGDLDKLMNTQFGSLTSMSRSFGVLTQNTFVAAASEMGGASEMTTAYMHLMEDCLGNIEEFGSKIGGAGVIGGLDIFKNKTDAVYTMLSEESPEVAEKVGQLQNKMKETFKADMLKTLSTGAMSLRNVWSQIKDMGLNDLATQTKMYDAALLGLFSSTVPMGEVQLERMWEDIKKLKDEMREAQNRTEGWNILIKALDNGLELTGEQLEKFRENAENLNKLEWIDVYHAMGIDRFELVNKNLNDVDDAIEAMRGTLLNAHAAIDVFEQKINALPDALGKTKMELMAFMAVFDYLISIVEEMVDVTENLYKLPELLEGMGEAIEKGDLGAFIDDLQTLTQNMMDMVQVLSMVSELIPSLEGLSNALMKLTTIMQLLVTFYQIGELFKAFASGIIDWLDASAALEETTKDWMAFKLGVYEVIKVIAELLSYIPFVGEMLSKALLIDWKDILNLDDAKKEYLDVEDMYKKLKALTEDTFIDMTLTIAEFIRDFGKFGLDVDLSNLKDEWERYFTWMRENWQRMIDLKTFGPHTEDILKEMMENAVAYYREMIEDMFDAFVKQFTDFAQQIKEDIQGMTKTGEVRGGIEQRGRTAADIMADEEETRAKMKKDILEGDWESWLEHAQELRGELLERYDLEEQRLQEIIGWIEQLKDFTHTLKLDMQNLAEEGRTTKDIEADMAETRKILLSDMNGDWDTWIEKAQEMRDLILERYETEKKLIEETYGKQIEEMEKIKDAFKSLGDSVRKQILDIKTGGTNQRDIYERLATQYAEVERLRGLAAGATGEERAGYQGELATALGGYLTMAEQAYTRPSLAYQAIYEAVLAELQAIQTEAETKVTFAESEIIRLNTEMKDKLEALRLDTIAKLTELNQWATTLGITLEGMKTAQEKKLEDIRLLLEKLLGVEGESGVLLVIGWVTDIKEKYLQSLLDIGNIAGSTWWCALKLTEIANNIKIGRRDFEPKILQAGLGQVPYTGYVASLHKGETILPAGTPVSTINLGGITVNVQGGAGVNGKTIAKQLEQEVRYGRLGMVIKDTMKKVA